MPGEASLPRVGDDGVVAFQDTRKAENFDRKLTTRLKSFGRSLTPEKTRMMLVGRCARERVESYGRQPGTFACLGCKPVSGIDTKGTCAVVRLPADKRCRQCLDRTYAWLRRHRHWRRREPQRYLAATLTGFSPYGALNRGVPTLARVKQHVEKPWRHAIKRQSQRPRVCWSYLRSRAWLEWPQPKVRHWEF